MKSPDAQVLLMLSSQLGLTQQAEFKPLTLTEYNQVARLLADAGMRPGDLLEYTLTHLEQFFNPSGLDAKRLFGLLQRGASIGFHTERLESLGIFILTRADKEYPQKLRDRLRESAPPVLFISGEVNLLGSDQPSIAVVGSRNVDEVGIHIAQVVGNACAVNGYVLVSGGAKGVDTLAMDACIGANGNAVGILANDLEREVLSRQSILRKKDLCLFSPYTPNAPFNVGNAMGRNKLIYAMAEYAIVVASDSKQGGTWAGANEALRKQWVPVFVLEHDEMPQGNRDLIKLGMNPLPGEIAKDPKKLITYLKSQSKPITQEPAITQYSFGSLGGFSVKDQSTHVPPKKK